MKKLFLTLSLLVSVVLLSSFTSNNDSVAKENGYWVVITTTCGVTETMYVGGPISSVYDAAMVLEHVFCD